MKIVCCIKVCCPRSFLMTTTTTTTTTRAATGKTTLYIDLLYIHKCLLCFCCFRLSLPFSLPLPFPLSFPFSLSLTHTHNTNAPLPARHISLPLAHSFARCCVDGVAVVGLHWHNVGRLVFEPFSSAQFSQRRPLMYFKGGEHTVVYFVRVVLFALFCGAVAASAAFVLAVRQHKMYR